MKTLYFIFFIAFFSVSTFAQYDQKPSRSRFYNSKLSSFTISPGDILVYEFRKNDSLCNYVATVKKYGDEIVFDYVIPQLHLKGTKTIASTAVSDAVLYDTLLAPCKPTK